MIDTNIAAVKEVAITDDSIAFELNDGRTVTIPIALYPRLLHGSKKERDNWRLISQGKGIHWLDLDEDISVENIIAGKPSGESQKIS